MTANSAPASILADFYAPSLLTLPRSEAPRRSGQETVDRTIRSKFLGRPLTTCEPTEEEDRPMTKVLNVENMHCGGCVKSVTRAIKSVAPAAEIAADVARRTVEIRGVADMPKILRALDDAGFPGRLA
jgi:copper chaperone